MTDVSRVIHLSSDDAHRLAEELLREIDHYPCFRSDIEKVAVVMKDLFNAGRARGYFELGS